MANARCHSCRRYQNLRIELRVRMHKGKQTCNECKYDAVPFNNKGFCPEQDRLDEIRELSELSAEYYSR